MLSSKRSLQVIMAIPTVRFLTMWLPPATESCQIPTRSPLWWSARRWWWRSWILMDRSMAGLIHPLDTLLYGELDQLGTERNWGAPSVGATCTYSVCRGKFTKGESSLKVKKTWKAKDIDWFRVNNSCIKPAIVSHYLAMVIPVISSVEDYTRVAKLSIFLHFSKGYTKCICQKLILTFDKLSYMYAILTHFIMYLGLLWIFISFRTR